MAGGKESTLANPEVGVQAPKTSEAKPVRPVDATLGRIDAVLAANKPREGIDSLAKSAPITDNPTQFGREASANPAPTEPSGTERATADRRGLPHASEGTPDPNDDTTERFARETGDTSLSGQKPDTQNSRAASRAQRPVDRGDIPGQRSGEADAATTQLGREGDAKANPDAERARTPDGKLIGTKAEYAAYQAASAESSSAEGAFWQTVIDRNSDYGQVMDKYGATPLLDAVRTARTTYGENSDEYKQAVAAADAKRQEAEDKGRANGELVAFDAKEKRVQDAKANVDKYKDGYDFTAVEAAQRDGAADDATEIGATGKRGTERDDATEIGATGKRGTERDDATEIGATGKRGAEADDPTEIVDTTSDRRDEQETGGPDAERLEALDREVENLSEQAASKLARGEMPTDAEAQALQRAATERDMARGGLFTPEEARDAVNQAFSRPELSGRREHINQRVQEILQKIATNLLRIKAIPKDIPNLRGERKKLQMRAKNERNQEKRLKLYDQINKLNGRINGLRHLAGRLTRENRTLEQRVQGMLGVRSKFSAMARTMVSSIGEAAYNAYADAAEGARDRIGLSD
jgi:hypothetical protein